MSAPPEMRSVTSWASVRAALENAAAREYAGSGRSCSTASSQLNHDVPSTTSSSTGTKSSPSPSPRSPLRSTRRSTSCRKRRWTETAGWSVEEWSCSKRNSHDIAGGSLKLARSAHGGPSTPNCQRDWFFRELAR